MNAFYGNPDGNSDGLPDPAFETQHLTYIIPPYPMVFAWNMKPVLRIKLNKKCADSALAALARIGREFDAGERQEYGLDRLGGGYTFRMMRGIPRLSIHSWGAAIDLAPDLNPLGAAPGSRPNMMPPEAVEAFRAEGWAWGGDWRRPDPMHFQAARA